MRPLSIFALAIASLLLFAAPAAAAPPDVKKPPPPLTAQWWQSFMAIDDPNGLDRCDIGTADVVFLAGNATGDRLCTVSAEKSILVPLVNVECSVLEGDGTTPADLRSKCRGITDQAANLTLLIDGVSVPDLTKFRVGSEVFTFTSSPNNPFGIKAGTTRSVADGYWVLIGPLAAGQHTIEFGGAFPTFNPPFATHATYKLTVQ
jgi:hypothetical protein